MGERKEPNPPPGTAKPAAPPAPPRKVSYDQDVLVIGCPTCGRLAMEALK